MLQPSFFGWGLEWSSNLINLTAIQLIEIFYDVPHGHVFVDGDDGRDYSVLFLRNKIGYVGLLPTFFKISIRYKIALGASIEIKNGKHER